MTARTITFAVQIGSGGFEVARLVADKIGYQYYDWEVTSTAAKAIGVSPGEVEEAEYVPGLVQRVMGSLAAATSYATEVGFVPPPPSPKAMGSAIHGLGSNVYRHFIEGVVREIAERGASVIVGHAGQVVLRRDTDILKVLVCGSPQERAKRLATDASLGFDAAESAVVASDLERVRFFRHVYHVDLLSPMLYNLVVNTDALSLDAVASLVLAAAEKIGAPKEESLPLAPAPP